MRAKRLQGLILAIATAATLAMAGTAAASSDGKPTLQVVTDPSFVPFEMMDKDSGKMVGFDMSILKAVAKRSGFDYKLRTMDFNGIIPALQTGNADMALAGITITAERAKVVDFSNPYYNSGLRILRAKGDDSINTIDDLKGKRIGTKIGSTSYDFLKKKFGNSAQITPYPGSADMYLALMNHSIDAVFYDAPNVAYFARTRGQGRVETVGPLYEGQQYGIAFKAGSKWVGKVNDALASMKKDGSYTKIYKHWFGELPPADSK
ncbi:MAG: transporter substrate-binding domain-containing protein [Salinisphaera sp.]|jgi:glutamine transport system substrate-binding protein|nr:transporter substrate-binding domain-containing protein [Salinisphaera sp.]